MPAQIISRNAEESVYLRPRGTVPGIGAETGTAKRDGVSRFDSADGSYRYVTFVAGRPVAALQVVHMPGLVARIANVYTVPEHRRKGYAAKMLRQARKDFGIVEHAPEKHLSDEGKKWRDQVERNPWEVTADLATQRGIEAIAMVMTPRIDYDDGLDFARNSATALLDLQEDETVFGLLVEALRNRRKNWPNKVWGGLSDSEIDELATDAADVWRHGEPLQRNGGTLRRTRVSFDRHFDEAANRFPDLGTIELHHDDSAGGDNGHGSERQFGFCEDDKPIRISFASKIEALPQENIDGLVAHEFGHALDFRYGKRELERMLEIRLPDGAERRADAIAGAVFGKTIRYDEALVQCVSCKGQAPRPRRLGA